MKKFLGNAAKVALGIVIGSSMTAFATQLVSNVYSNPEIKITINGVVQTLRDATTGEIEYPLTYKNRTYIPLRSVATLLGYNVGYDQPTNTATVDSPDYVKPTTTETPTTPTTSTLSVDNIPIVSALNWKDAPLTDSSSMLKNNYIVSNVANQLYQSIDLGPSEEAIHPETPLKDELKKAVAKLVTDRNSIGSGASLLIFCDQSSVRYLKFGYDSAGKAKGCLATYTLEYTFTYNGQTQKRTQDITSIFIFKDDANSRLAWVGDVQ